MQLRALQSLSRPRPRRSLHRTPCRARVLLQAPMTSSKGLSGIPLPMLEELLTSVERGRLECPFTETDLVDSGFRGKAADVVAALGASNSAAVLTTLRAVIAERIHRPPPRL